MVKPVKNTKPPVVTPPQTIFASILQQPRGVPTIASLISDSGSGRSVITEAKKNGTYGDDCPEGMKLYCRPY